MSVPVRFVRVVIPIHSEDEFLLVIENKKFSIPGGNVEPGEQPLKAAFREVKEELGIYPDELEVINSSTFTEEDDSGPFQTITYLMLLSQIPKSTVPVGSLDNQGIYYGDVSFLDDYPISRPAVVYLLNRYKPLIRKSVAELANK